MFEELLILVTIAAVVLSIPLACAANADNEERWNALQDAQAERRNASGRPFDRRGPPLVISQERSGAFGARWPRSQAETDALRQRAEWEGRGSTLLGDFGNRIPEALDR